MKLYKLHFSTPLHISNVRSDYGKSETIIHSDTLYSAIFQAWSVLGMENRIPKETSTDFGFTLSSLFPFTANVKTTETVYFLPRPMNFAPEVEIEKNKKAKEIEFFDLDYFNEYLKNGKFSNNFIESVDGKYLTKQKIDNKFLNTDVYPRVTIPREGGDAKPFYMDKIYFKEKSGLYFLAEFQSTEIEKAFLAALKYLGDEGLGTDRHIGNGLFSYEPDKIDFEEIPQSNYSVNLSLYCPENNNILAEQIEESQEMPDKKTCFELIQRGGWITNPAFSTLRKRSVYMLKEAGIFKTNQRIAGKTVDLKPEIEWKDLHSIYRVGKSIFLPINVI